MAERTDEALSVHIGAQITRWREIRGLTVKALADAIEIDASNMTKTERGRFGVSIPRLSRIAAVLGVPLAVLADPAVQGIPVIGELQDGQLGNLWLPKKPIECLPLPHGQGQIDCAFKAGASSWLLTADDGGALVSGQLCVLLMGTMSTLVVAEFRHDADDADQVRNRRLAMSLLGEKEPEGGLQAGRGWFHPQGKSLLTLPFHRDDERIRQVWPVVGLVQLPDRGPFGLDSLKSHIGG